MNRSAMQLGSKGLRAEDCIALLSDKKNLKISNTTRKLVDRSEAHVRRIAKGDELVYSINTGFGPLCSTKINAAELEKLQSNILKSHSVGVGPALTEDLVRLMLSLKIHSLCLGHSGARWTTIQALLGLLKDKAYSEVPVQGSVGASGDLAPLAHLFLPLIGKGFVFEGKRKITGSQFLKRRKLQPLKLAPKEGLALLNGTQFILAHAIEGLKKMQGLLDAADIISAMSLEALLGSAAPFHAKLHAMRPFEGCVYVAKRMRHLLQGSEILKSHLNCNRVQDPYSLRCVPQVHGASRNAWRHLYELVNIEINSVTDNPVITDDGMPISGGNFHGQPLAMVLDYASIAASELGNISDRRSYLLLEGKVEGLPKLLMRDTGVNSGFMIPQYTSAALVSENKSLLFPASGDSIPTSLGQEDHVSMGSISGRKFLQIIDNVEKVLAVELVCAAQAFDFRSPLKSGLILEACHQAFRKRVNHASKDRVFAMDIEEARKFIANAEIHKVAKDAAKKARIPLKGDEDERFGFSR